MNQNFIEYASYVIKDRAITQIEDGLKPVQRRIMHSLNEMDDGKFHKVANVVGNTMKYHPHGDASIYSALVNIANKDYFIEKQGNFGNIFTGDSASAARYIECRLTPLAKEVLYSKEITEFLDSYDGRNLEPLVFPCKIPYLLLAGTEGIAVGMSTKVLPHNFNEVLEAQIKFLKEEEFEIFPDFLQGGLIDVSEYEKGNGKVKIRAIIEQSANKVLVIKEIPYGTTTDSLITSIENAAKKNKIKINSINDFTSENVEIEITLSKGYDAQDAIKALYAFTDCEISTSVNLIVIENGKPIFRNINDVLQRCTELLVENLRKELQIDLDKNQEKLHFKTLEQIFIENRIYKDIEECKTYEATQKAVLDGVNNFRELLQRDVNLDDVEKLLQIQIKRISRYDIEKNRKEVKEINKKIREIKANLKNIITYSINYVQAILDKFGKNYSRKTKISSFEEITLKEVAIKNTKLGYDKASGFIGSSVKSDKFIETSPYHKILMIFKDGIYKVINVPDKLFVGKGLLYFDVVSKEITFNLIYRDKKSNYCYIKRFQISKFILEKEYNLFDSKSNKLEQFNWKENFAFRAEYEKTKGMKVLFNDFLADDFLIKGVGAKGVRIATKNIIKFRILNNSQTAELEQAKEENESNSAETQKKIQATSEPKTVTQEPKKALEEKPKTKNNEKLDEKDIVGKIKFNLKKIDPNQGKFDF